MSRNIKAIIFIFVASLLAVSAVSAEEDACITKFGTWDAKTQKCEIKSGVEVSLKYPLELAGKGIAETTVDSYLQQTQQQFVQAYTPDYSLPAYANYWTMDIDYELYHFSDSVMTIKFNFDYYTGGAHPNHDFKTFTFDLAGNKEIALEDLFAEGTNPWKAIDVYVEQDLSKHLAEAIGTQLISEDLAIIHSGTGENPDNYRNFALTPDSLIFFFPPYQVAAYAAGPQQVSIPLSQLIALLNPEFQPKQ